MVKISVSAVRRPDGGRKGRNGKEVLILGPATVTVPENFTSTHNAPPPFSPYHFAFWSVVGSQPGPFVWFNPAVQITTGTTDVVAKAWYVLDDPKPASGTGVLVDAFDVDLGRFLDDDFATVEGDAKRTDEANTAGLVRTPSTGIVDAASSIGSAAFDNWLCVTGIEPLNGQTLTAEKGTSAEAIAFYKQQPPPPPHPQFGLHRFFADQAWVSWGVKVDGGGPWGGGPPIPPWGPLTLGLGAGLALAEAAQKLHPTLQKEALGLAARQVSLAADAISKAINSAAQEADQK